MDLLDRKHLGRYEILARLGAGGMGDVYRALDPQLGRQVAIKVVQDGVALNPERLARFEHEARAASALNHPNVVTIYEIGRVDGVPYIAMELVEGRTLRRLLDDGVLPVRQALRLALQVADAMACAHGAGIVHRDLKPENIMVDEGGRVRVLDFGLAKQDAATVDEHASTGHLLSPATASGIILGTVGYMSPEQASGRPADFRSDQFSFGTILYELLTGKHPFRRPTGAQTLAAIIEREPEPPLEIDPRLPPGLVRVARRCLEKEPAARYGSTVDLARDLHDLHEQAIVASSSSARHALTSASWALSRATRPARRALIGMALATPAIAGVALWISRPAPRPVPVAEPGGRPSLAVLGFKNLAGRPEAAWLSTALAEMLTTELAAGGRLRLIAGENVARMRLELKLPEADALAADTLARVGRNLGTERVLIGSFLQQAEELRLDLRLQDVGTGETIVHLAESGSEARLVELVRRTGARLRQALGLESQAAPPPDRLAAVLPSSLEGQKLYAAGLARLRVLDALAANELLLKAAAFDRDSPFVHSALAEAASMLGYDARAREEARKAFDLAAALPREDSLLMEARYREMAREWDSAIAGYRTLFGLFSDDLDHGLRLVGALNAAGRSREALDVLHRLPGPASADPRVALAEALVAQTMGDFTREELAATRAAEAAEKTGARLLVARALYLQAYALERLGQLERAMQATVRSRAIYEEAGDQAGLAGALGRMGELQWYRGEIGAARRNLEQALRLRGQIGHRRGVAGSLAMLGLLAHQQGNLAEALKLHQEARSIADELGDTNHQAIHTENMAAVLYEQGQLERARAAVAEAKALYRALGDEAGAASGSITLADVQAAAGDLSGAKASLETVLPLLRAATRRTETASALLRLSRVRLRLDDLAGARRDLEEALSLFQQLGQRIDAAEVRLALAELATEDGPAAEAERAARETASVFAAAGTADKQVLALAAVGRARHASGHTAEAREVMAEAAAGAARSQNPQVRLSVKALVGRLRGTPDEARAAAAEASRLGLATLALECALTAAEAEAEAGRTTAAAMQARQVEQDARARGHLRTAARAKALAGPSGS